MLWLSHHDLKEAIPLLYPGRTVLPVQQAQNDCVIRQFDFMVVWFFASAFTGVKGDQDKKTYATLGYSYIISIDRRVRAACDLFIKEE